MLQLSDAAGERLHKSLAATREKNQESNSLCFRVVPKDDKMLTLKIAKPAPSDTRIEYDGSTVLAVPKALGPFFKKRTLDIDKTGNLRVV